jgi:hypothetical protein
MSPEYEEMKNAIVTATLILAAATSGLGADASEKTARIENPKELLKLNKDLFPPNMMGGGFFRLSPSENRYIYIRMYPGDTFGCKLHFGQFKPSAIDSPAVWDRAIPSFYCRMTFAGITWRSDSQRALFLQEIDTKQKVAQRMTPWEMKWDIKKPQFGRARHMVLGDNDSTSCTSASYSPDGKILWTAFGDPKDFKACGITEKTQGRDKSRVVYRNTGRLIHHLTPSPNGKLLSWVETSSSKLAKSVAPDVVIVDIKSRKVIRRIGLSNHGISWLGAQAPVWTADSAGICYGDVVKIGRLWRREVRITKLSDKTSRLLARDSIAIGAADGGIVLNRGPSCVPMSQHFSSWRGPGGITPTTDTVIFCSPAAKVKPTTLINNASAQHVRAGKIIYSQLNGNDILIMRATLKLPPIAQKTPKN